MFWCLGFTSFSKCLVLYDHHHNQEIKVPSPKTLPSASRSSFRSPSALSTTPLFSKCHKNETIELFELDFFHLAYCISDSFMLVHVPEPYSFYCQAVHFMGALRFSLSTHQLKGIALFPDVADYEKAAINIHV